MLEQTEDLNLDPKTSRPFLLDHLRLNTLSHPWKSFLALSPATHTHAHLWFFWLSGVPMESGHREAQLLEFGLESRSGEQTRSPEKTVRWSTLAKA